VGAQTLPHDGGPRSSRKTKPTTFETLTSETRYGGSPSTQTSPTALKQTAFGGCDFRDVREGVLKED
jgi:hypothetical protein